MAFPSMFLMTSIWHSRDTQETGRMFSLGMFILIFPRFQGCAVNKCFS